MLDFLKDNNILIIVLLLLVIGVLTYLLIKSKLIKKIDTTPKATNSNDENVVENNDEIISKKTIDLEQNNFYYPKTVDDYVNENYNLCSNQDDWKYPSPTCFEDWEKLNNYFFNYKKKITINSYYDGKYFEKVFVSEILKHCGFNVRFNGGKTDHGIDLIAEHPLCRGIPIIIQCKCYSNIIFWNDIQLFNGIQDSVLKNYDNVIMLFITNNKIKDREAENYPNIIFVTKDELKTLYEFTINYALNLKLNMYLKNSKTLADNAKEFNKITVKVDYLNNKPVFKFCNYTGLGLETEDEFLSSENYIEPKSKKIISIFKIFQKIFYKANKNFNINRMFSFEFSDYKENGNGGYTIDIDVRLNLEFGKELDSSKFNDLYQIFDTSI